MTDKSIFTFKKGSSCEPLYKQVADYLQGLIVSGTIPVGEQFPAELDLAKTLGVSRLTLRKSLSILLAQDLIIQIPHCGTFVAEQKKKPIRIGLLLLVSDNDFKGFYGNQIILHFCWIAEKHPDIQIVFLICHDCTKKEISERISKSNCDGYIVLYGSQFFAQVLDQPKFDSVPIVYINKFNKMVDGLRFNVALETDPLKSAVDYLVKCGHKKIAYISADVPVTHLQERNHSFLAHCPEEAIPVIKRSQLTWFEYAKAETIRLCRSSERPTAIITPGISFTSGVIQGLMECKMTVPEDISFMGFDHIGEVYPILSTVEQPLKKMTDKALSLISDTVRGKVYRNHTFTYETELFDRGSIKKIEQ